MSSIERNNRRVLEEVYEILANLGRTVREQNGKALAPKLDERIRWSANGKDHPIRVGNSRILAEPHARKLTPTSSRKISEN